MFSNSESCKIQTGMISVDDLNPYNEYKVVKKDFSLSPNESLTDLVGQVHTNFNKFQRCVDNKANKWIFTPIINTKRHIVDEKGYEKLLTMAVVTLGTRFLAKRMAPQNIRSKGKQKWQFNLYF